MKTVTKDYYLHEGIQRDVNPFQNKDSDLLLSLNFWSPTFGQKDVRFGYKKILDNPDNSPVRKLLYYDLPASKGLFRISGSKIYRVNLPFSTSWGSSIKTLSVDSDIASTVLAGSVPYVHFSDSVDGYFTWDGFVWKAWPTLSPSDNKPSTITSWLSRIFCDVNKLRLAESADGFDLDSAYATDPFLLNNNDPSGGGVTSIDAGHNGSIIKMTSSIDRVQIYKQFGITRYNGVAFANLPFFGNILAVGSTKYDLDYVLATNGIWKNDGKSPTPADFGIQNVIRDTLNTYGIANPIVFSFDELTFFYVGNIRVGSGDGSFNIKNAMFVHNEQYDQWDIWSLGHNMTAFGYYIDQSINPLTGLISNQPIMVSGDENGNVYAWGDQYFSDDGIPIAYHLRTMYNSFGEPFKTKFPEAYSVSLHDGDASSISIATDLSDDYSEEIAYKSGYFASNRFQSITRAFKAISIEIKGITDSNRPQFLGYTIKYKSEEQDQERASNNSKTFSR